MADKETTESKHEHGDCCGGHCGSEDPAEQATVASSQNGTEEASSATEAKVEEIDWKVQAAYLSAEIENMHKRFLREASEIRKYSNEDMLKKLVPVLDTLSLAMNAAEKAKAQPENEALLANKVYQSFIQGVEMTLKQFEQALESCGVEFLNSKGKAFDPMLHEALGQTQTDGVEDNVITEEFQRGFKLSGRVIRHAKVIVNKK